ncbi:MAG: carboxypeptidase-like regulatory domain-containing protein [Chitinophagales bacterium]|nr:carboxypeptidase-like regulatory domain-containing protein [Bacteroidota bacterium]MCB9042763.1 carboxypeptidase-like regulatory domain-containing protein [Chitinophagales bacterium]
MKLFLLGFVFLLLGQNIFAQQYFLPYGGVLINCENGEKIVAAHIININTRKGTTSDENGLFDIPVRKYDKVVFSALGFYTDTLEITDQTYESFQARCLRPRTYQLEEVKVFPWRNISELKRAFLALELPDTMYHANLPELNLPRRLFYDPNTNISVEPLENGGIGVRGALSYLYGLVSKEGKMERERERVFAHEKQLDIIATKYNVALVGEIVGLENEDDIVKFMRFCNFSEDFLLQSQSYEIKRAIQLRYAAYVQN